MTAMTKVSWRWMAAAAVAFAGAAGCASESQATIFCVVDRDCPEQLVCDEGTCWEGAGAAGMVGEQLGSVGPDADDFSMDEALASGDDGTSQSDDNGAQSSNPEGCGAALTPDASRCDVSTDQISCAHNEATLDGRLIVWQTPLGNAPPDGWPAVIVFHGSGFGPDATWEGASNMPFGGFNQIRMQAMLLDSGFVVIAPTATGTAWDTNFPAYDASDDHRFIPLLLEKISTGAYGKVDSQRLHATGISSGGYMTSRMAVSYPGAFRSLAIESGSYATCSNVLCNVPTDLPADHPPTLFLHGANDIAVPIATAEAYHEQLNTDGVATEFIRDPTVGHQWLDVAPEAVTCWFMEH